MFVYAFKSTFYNTKDQNLSRRKFVKLNRSDEYYERKFVNEIEIQKIIVVDVYGSYLWGLVNLFSVMVLPTLNYR